MTLNLQARRDLVYRVLLRVAVTGYNDIKLSKANIFCFCYPVPDTSGGGVLFLIDLYLSFFVSLSTRLRENSWTDLHDIFREGVE